LEDFDPACAATFSAGLQQVQIAAFGASRVSVGRVFGDDVSTDRAPGAGAVNDEASRVQYK
jgi:hypothetical protein